MGRSLVLLASMILAAPALSQDSVSASAVDRISDAVEGIERYLRFSENQYLSDYRVSGIHFGSDTTATIYALAVDPRDGDDMSITLNAVRMADLERWVIVRAAERGGGMNASRWTSLWYVLE
jgi:hypothetical protein